MAWTTPKTWTDNEIILASGAGSLNEQIRDILNQLSVHAHTGAAGDGSATLSGVSFSNIAGFQFADQAADPTVDGTIQRNGVNILYYDGSAAIDLTASDQAAATPSLRSLGTTATTAAAGDHQHTISTSETTQMSTTGSASSAWNGFDTGFYDIASGNITASGTNKIFVASFWYAVTNSYIPTGTGVTGVFTYNLEFSYNGAVKKTVTGVQPNTYSAFVGTGIYNCQFLPNGTASTAYLLRANKTNTDSNTYILTGQCKINMIEVAVTM